MVKPQAERTRSLILAGGGLKVAYQAGCLQVLLDEAGLEFDHVDATSGGCFNAAMMASGMTGSQIADHWRTMNPRAFLTFAFGDLLRRGPWVESIGTNAGLKRIFNEIWKLDFERINRSQKPVYTFNHFSFKQKRVKVVENTTLDLQTLLASVSLLIWLPPVRIEGDVLFDAAYVTDANVGEAVRRGADEIWAIWTLTDTAEVRSGFLAQYFHILQANGNARFQEEWQKAASPSRTLHRLQQEVAVHETFVLSRDRLAAAVELGVSDTRKYVEDELGVSLPKPIPRATCGAPGIQFTETMQGYVLPGTTCPQTGVRDGKRYGNCIDVRLSIEAENLDAFLHQPEHRARVRGTVVCPIISAVALTLTEGSFECLASEEPDRGNRIPSRKRMRYSLQFSDLPGNRYRLEGEKLMNPGPLRNVWPDTTTLFTQLYITPTNGIEAPFAAGVLRVRPLGFLKQLSTLRAPGALNVLASLNAIRRFNQFFVGQLWDVYLRSVVVYAPF